jgi:hypothetical protein
MTDLRQRHFRFRTDATAVDAAPTWGAAEDTNFNPSALSPFRLRFNVLNADQANAIAATPWQISVSKNGGAYGAVTSSSTGGVQSSATASSSPDETTVLVPRLTGGTVAPSWTLEGVSVDLDFVNGRYYDSAVGSDPVLNLLLHMDGVPGGALFTDSTKRHTITAHGATTDTGRAKFGSASAKFGSGGTDYLSVDHVEDFAFGTGDFTIDFQFNVPTNSNQCNLFDLGTNGFVIYIGSDGKVRLFNGLSFVDTILGTTTVSINTFHHCALTRSSGIARLFLDGTQEGSNYTDTNYWNLTDASISIGSSAGSFGGSGCWIDELRIMNGYAAWSANFTAPSAPYSDVMTSLALANLLSISRASLGYAKTAGGMLTQFGSGQIRITDLGLLIEDAKTNFALFSQDFTNAAWVSNGPATTANTTQAPDGITTADKIIPSLAAAFQFLSQACSPSGLPAKISYSVYAKAAGYNYCMLIGKTSSNANGYRVMVDLTSGAVVQNGVDAGSPTNTSFVTELLSNGWVRIILNMDGVTNASILVGVNDTSTWRSFGGDGVSGIYAWGAQVEVSGFVTSYIPTTGTSATRAADLITVIGDLDAVLSGVAASEYAEHGGTLANFGQGGGLIGLNGDLSSLLNGASNSSAVGMARGTPGISVTIGNGLNWTNGFKAASAFSASARSLVAGGGTVATSGAGLTSQSGFLLGVGGSGDSWLYGYMKRVAVWNSKISDATLQALTMP